MRTHLPALSLILAVAALCSVAILAAPAGAAPGEAFLRVTDPLVEKQS